MKKLQYKTRAGDLQWKPVFNKAFERACMNDTGTGFCLACGKTQNQCEPDAKQYTCNHCKCPKVYGLEELVIMGLVG